MYLQMQPSCITPISLPRLNMATRGNSSINQVGTSGGLSAEQLRRMEENKRRAQEKLARRVGGQPVKLAPPLTGSNVIGPPPLKRRAVHPHDSHHMQQSSGSSLSYLQPSRPPFVATPTFQEMPDSAFSLQPPQVKMPVGMKKPCDPTMTSSASTYVGCSTDICPLAQQSRPSSSTNVHVKPSGALPVVTKSKFTDLKTAVKATLTLVSRTRFKALVQYEANLIELFKRMPTRAYDAKTATWSFGIEDYNRLVETIRRECKYVQLNLIPKPVITLFLSSMRGKNTGSNSQDGCMDWGHIDEKLVSTLMQFQKEGVEFCIRHGGRVLLADDMGLGKTLQAIAVMCYYRSEWPLLVVCPSSVKFGWAEAFKHWVPSLSEAEVNVVLTSKDSPTRGLVNILSYDLLTRMARETQEKGFRAVIADESHFLKNYKTSRSKAALPIIKGATRSLLLSGTPALSRPIELFTQISALDKGFRVSLVEFGLRYCNGVKNHFGWDFSGASNMQELHMYMEERLMIRRLKEEVLDQLPSKRRQMVLLDPSLTKAKSKEMRQELDRAGTLKALDRKGALLPLFNKTGLMKIPAISGYILDLLEGGRKLIIFGHHKAVLDAICESLDGKKLEYVRIDGRTPAELRQTYCDQFQHDEQCLAAVLSITTANAGLTLTAASTVVFAELFWNPGILVQAEDRAYRIGQKNSVNIHYLVARDTADDFIWPLIQSKLQVLSLAGLAKEDFSNADSKVMKDMTQKDLLEYFGDVPESIEATDVPVGGQCEGGSSVSKAPQAKHINSTPAALGFQDDLDFQDHYSKSFTKSCKSDGDRSSFASKTSGKSDKPKGKTLDTFVMKNRTNDSVCRGTSMEEGKNPAARLPNYLLSSVIEDSPHYTSESVERRDISQLTSSDNTGPCECVNEDDSHGNADSTNWFANLESDNLGSFEEFDHDLL